MSELTVAQRSLSPAERLEAIRIAHETKCPDVKRAALRLIDAEAVHVGPAHDWPVRLYAEAGAMTHLENV